MKGCTWPLPDGFPPGSRATIKGIPTSDTIEKVFAINFVSKLPCAEGDVSYHASFRYGEEYVVNNSATKSEGFQRQERHQKLPIFPGKPFQIVIVCETTHFSLHIDGNHFSDFQHRMPFKNVKGLTVVGSVKVTSVEVDRIKSIDWPFPNGFRKGETVAINGFLLDDSRSEEFEIHFRNSPPNITEIPFRMAVRFKEGKILNNTFESNAWGKEEMQRVPPFEVGKRFEIAISYRNLFFKVFVNDAKYVYNLRIPHENIKHLIILGHVHISSVDVNSAKITPKRF